MRTNNKNLSEKVFYTLPGLWRGHSSSEGPEEGGTAVVLFFPSVEAAAEMHQWTVCSAPPEVSAQYENTQCQGTYCNKYNFHIWVFATS